MRHRHVREHVASRFAKMRRRLRCWRRATISGARASPLLPALGVTSHSPRPSQRSKPEAIASGFSCSPGMKSKFISKRPVSTVRKVRFRVKRTA